MKLQMRVLGAGILLTSFAMADPAMAWPRIVRAEGVVLINNEPVAAGGGQTIVKEDFVIATGEGRAEMTLRGGGWLVLGPKAAVRVVDNRGAGGSKLEVKSGSAMLATGDQAWMTATCEKTISLSERARVRIEAKAGEAGCLLRVYEGAAAVPLATVTSVLTPGRAIGVSIRCGDMIPVQEFKREEMDDLDRWSSARR